ncbi:MAG: metallophosphoesterase [Candidatus Pacebacteria bacterium]|nr:metallophosphoesterase [Candidatus Paceibacterota bacterium]
MKIAIVSDTHGNFNNFKRVIDFLNKENIKIILHCGDIGSYDFLKESLSNFKGKFFGVLGNMDSDFKFDIEKYQNPPFVLVKEDIYEIEIDKKKIAFTHFPEVAKNLAQTQKYDLVFYGHTHKPWEEKIENCRMVNPGNVCGVFYKPTFAIYDTKSDKLELKILEKI